MRTVDASTLSWLQNAPDEGYTTRDVVHFVVRSFADPSVTQTFTFWGEIDPETVSVVDPSTGGPVALDCVGDGALLSCSEVKLTSDLTVQTLNVSLSQIHATVQNMVRGYDVRLATIWLHRAAFDPGTRALVAMPLPHFFGKVDKSPVGTPAVGDEGSVNIQAVSHIRELTRTNPAKKSDETQKRRSGDRFRRYNSTAGDTDVFWGLRKERASGSATEAEK